MRRGMLYGFSAENQVASRQPSLPIVWTEFSPLRSFLWAVFKSDVLQPVPGPGTETKLKTPWKCRDHEHVGVLVLKFQPSLSSATGEANCTIPPGREAEWTHIARTPTEGGTPETLWRRFASIHRNALPTWPPTIHCREYGAQLLMLSPYIKQFRRTVWFGADIPTLQASHRATYSISLVMTRQEATPTDKMPRPESTGVRLRGLWNGAYEGCGQKKGSSRPGRYVPLFTARPTKAS